MTLAKLNNLCNNFINAVKDGTYKEKGWGTSCYGTSKVALIALSNIMAKEEKSNGIKINACCPGYCDTDMSSHKGPRPAEKGAETPVYLALGIKNDGPTGKFFYDM